jgi:hypothetical protein
MTKLTDTQLIVLSSAAKHDEGLATKPLNLHAAAAMKVASSLIDKSLVREIRAKADAPVWHENDDGRFALKITKAGREAIGVDDKEAEKPGSSPANSPGSRSKKGAVKAAASKEATKAPASRPQSTTPRAPAEAETSPGQIRAGSKQAIIVDLMVRPKGASLDELIGATDWLPHTTRAALTGLRKRGYAIERTRGDDKITRYRATLPEGTAPQSNQEPAAAASPKPPRAKAA